MSSELAIVERPTQAAALLEPVRARILEHLREPDSAAGAARALKIPRQRLGYHVRELERVGLVREVGERRRRNYVERLLQASAKRYVISPAALGASAPSPDEFRDRFSSHYLVATAARVVEEVGTVQQLAAEAGKSLPTLTVETVVRVATPEAQNAFANKLAECVARLVAEHHDEHAAQGRSFRVFAGAYPMPPAPRSPVTAPANVQRQADS